VAVVQSTLDALPHQPAATADEIAHQRQAAALTVVALRPRDPMEAILAGRTVASHPAAMDSLRCASQSGLPLALKLRFLGKFAALSRLADATRLAFTQAQSRPALQPVTVPVPIPAPRPQPAPAAAAPVTAASPAVAAPPAVPQRAATRPAPALSLPVAAGGAPHPAIAATAPPGRRDHPTCDRSDRRPGAHRRHRQSSVTGKPHAP